ncbi:MAG: hypothetical protein ABI478_15460, partial [Propionivibrio sp.]
APTRRTNQNRCSGTRVARFCSFGEIMFELVTPAKAGVQDAHDSRWWIPAFAGMTEDSNFI